MFLILPKKNKKKTDSFTTLVQGSESMYIYLNMNNERKSCLQ